MNILLLASHAVAEFDDIRMFNDLGYGIFAPGGYEVPARSGEGIRPPLPRVHYHADLHAKCEEVRFSNGDPGYRVDWAKAAVHPEVIDWADVIIVHHFPEVWIGQQWDAIKHKRVIWRTCGQSSPDGSLERHMAPFRAQGLEIVRYSPKERSLPDYAGEDDLIRFGKYPSDYGPWSGEMPAVINITQHMAQRGDACGYPVWQDVTRGLARWFEGGPPCPWAIPLGPGSDEIGGPGKLTFDEMLHWLRRARAYLYTGTQPASYTLGLIEAMLSGIPVVAVNGWVQPELRNLWEADDIIEHNPLPGAARQFIDTLFEDRDFAAFRGEEQRQRAIDLFGIETIGAQWKAYLG